MTYGEVYHVSTTTGLITVMYVGPNPNPSVIATEGDAVIVVALNNYAEPGWTLPLRVSLHEWTLVE